MEKSALSIYHGQKGKPGPPIVFYFPEPELQDRISLTKESDAGKGWQTASMGAVGIGRYFSYRQYKISEPTTFVSEPSEAVVCLRMHVGGGSFFGYGGKSPSVSLDFRDNRLFWQGDRKTENKLMLDEHTLVELYFRPECLAHLVGIPVVGDIIDLSLAEPFGPMDQYVFVASGELDSFLLEFLDEIDYKRPTVERFHYLCDCLILMCLGETVDVLPPKGTAVAEEVDGTEHAPKTVEVPNGYVVSPSEREILSALEGLGRQELLRKFWKLHRKVQKLENKWTSEDKLSRDIEKTVARVQQRQKDRLAIIYMKMARFLAARHSMEMLTQNQRTLVKRAVIRACKRAFDNRLPSLSEAEFYAKWSGRPYISQSFGMDAFADLLSMFLPPEAPGFSGVDNTSKGKMLFDEKIRENFGFRHMSDLTGKTAEDKPKEVVELYKYLMGHFSETLTLRDDSGLERSDVVRMLDNAYEYDDLLGMLQIEISYLADKPGYVDRQDDERVRWFILALEFNLDYFEEMLEELHESPGYADLQLFNRLGQDMKRFKKALAERTSSFGETTDKLAKELRSVSADPTVENTIALAKMILIPKR